MPQRCTYTPGTDVIDITAPGGIDALLEFHRVTFGAAVMEHDEDDVEVDDEDDDEGDTGVDDGDDQDDTDDDGEGADQLGDAGKRALDRMKATLKAERTKRRAAEEALAAKDGDEQTRQVERAALDKANDRIKRSEIKAAAKGVLADPNDAFKFLDLDQIEVDDDGGVDEDEIADALAALVRDKPYLAAQGGRRFQGSAGGGAGQSGRPKQLTQADLSAMTPDQIVKARQKGQLDDLLQGKRR